MTFNIAQPIEAQPIEKEPDCECRAFDFFADDFVNFIPINCALCGRLLCLGTVADGRVKFQFWRRRGKLIVDSLARSDLETRPTARPGKRAQPRRLVGWMESPWGGWPPEIPQAGVASGPPEFLR